MTNHSVNRPMHGSTPNPGLTPLARWWAGVRNAMLEPADTAQRPSVLRATALWQSSPPVSDLGGAGVRASGLESTALWHTAA